jgi:hypothetical protein
MDRSNAAKIIKKAPEGQESGTIKSRDLIVDLGEIAGRHD